MLRYLVMKDVCIIPEGVDMEEYMSFWGYFRIVSTTEVLNRDLYIFLIETNN